MSGPRRQIRLGFTEEPFPEGTHMCHIFSDEGEQAEVMARYVSTGLAEGEQVAYFVDTLPVEELRRRLASLGVPVPAPDDPQLLVSPAVDMYCPDGTFIPDRMLANFPLVYGAGVEAGFAGVRATGEMSWARRGLPGSDLLIEYESRINTVVREVPLTAVCQYDARQFDGATLFEVLMVHPVMIVRGRISRNPYYLPPEEFRRRGHGAAGTPC
ncbi:MAG: MEDS domain-containing protein [Thermoanaerobaculia bacterium]|jgi:hypothetical protein|nr:MEDS domain-containing protein [Thermoanaerobaculia bacterium]